MQKYIGFCTQNFVLTCNWTKKTRNYVCVMILKNRLLCVSKKNFLENVNETKKRRKTFSETQEKTLLQIYMETHNHFFLRRMKCNKLKIKKRTLKNPKKRRKLAKKFIRTKKIVQNVTKANRKQTFLYLKPKQKWASFIVAMC